MTKKEFVLKVVEGLRKNPAILKSHKISQRFVKMIMERPDILGKLATFAWSTQKGRRMGAKGLRAFDGFKISFYRNFPTFNAEAREDVETFLSGLSEESAINFTTQNNVVTIIMLPDTPTGDDSNDIVNLKSVAVTFDTSVKREYKIPGGMYITIMFDDSLIARPEAVKAKTKSNINKRKEQRRTVGKIKAELKSKANRKLAALNVDNYNIGLKMERLQGGRNQLNTFGTTFGASEGDSPKKLVSMFKKYTDKNNKIIGKLSPEDREKFDQALSFYKSGEYRKSSGLLRSINNPELVRAVKFGVDVDDAMTRRKSELSKKIKYVQSKLNILLERLEGYETDGNSKGAADTRFAMRKHLTDMANLKGRYEALSEPTVESMKARDIALNELVARYESNVAKSASISEALEASLNQLSADDVTKAEILQDIAEETVNQQIPVEYAIENVVKSRGKRKKRKVSTVVPQVTQQVTSAKNNRAISEKTLAGKMSFSRLLDLV